MAVKLGLDAKLFRNTGTYAAPTWNEIKNVKDVTLNLEAGEADVTTRGNNGWRATVATLKDGSIEFEMVWDSTDDDFTAIRDAFLNKTALEMAVMDGDVLTAGSQGLRASFMVTGFNITANSSSKPPVAHGHVPTWPTMTTGHWHSRRFCSPGVRRWA